MSGYGWCFCGAYFLAKFEASGAYKAGAYKKKRVSLGHQQIPHHRFI